MDKTKILVVDDEDKILMVLERRLVSEGYEVVTAHDGLEGLEKAQTENPDLIILDVMMPKMDGCTVMERIRKMESPIRNVPIIIMSAKADMERLFNGYDIHCFIPKPFESEVLLGRIREILA